MNYFYSLIYEHIEAIIVNMFYANHDILMVMIIIVILHKKAKLPFSKFDRCNLIKHTKLTSEQKSLDNKGAFCKCLASMIIVAKYTLMLIYFIKK